MDFKKLISRYKQFGGLRLVVEYAKLGALWPAVKTGVRCVFKRQSFKGIYPAVLKRVEPHLIKRYGSIVQGFKSSRSLSNENHNENENNASTGSATERPIWFCWLQGFEQAPPIVNACYSSLKRNIPDREIKVIDGQNWREYVEMPEYIVKKWEKGRIPAALFSDLLRLELLVKYGGTWIDSTVLCTGVNDNDNQNENLGSLRSKSIENHTENLSNSQLTTGSKLSTLNSELKHKMLEYLTAELFLFQYSRPGSTDISISNWFITARKNNEVLMVLREMLYAYWKDYDCTLDYYMFHLFFSLIAKEYPVEIAKMPYGYSPNSLVLLHHWGEQFDQKKWDKLTGRVSFHKLAFRVGDDIKKNNSNFYNYILNKEYGRI